MCRDNQIIPLAALVGIRAGYPARSKIEHSDDGRVCIVQPMNIKPWEPINYAELHRFNPPNYSQSMHRLRNGDVLFFGRAGQRYAVLVDKLPAQMVVAAGSILILSCRKSEILPEYLVWFLNSREAHEYFEIMTGGIPQQVVTKTILEKLPVDLPDTETQREIVKVWDMWLEEQKITQKYLQAKSRLLDAGIRSLKDKAHGK